MADGRNIKPRITDPRDGGKLQKRLRGKSKKNTRPPRKPSLARRCGQEKKVKKSNRFEELISRALTLTKT